jgi:hypothetical protein
VTAHPGAGFHVDYNEMKPLWIPAKITKDLISCLCKPVFIGRIYANSIQPQAGITD